VIGPKLKWKHNILTKTCCLADNWPPEARGKSKSRSKKGQLISHSGRTRKTPTDQWAKLASLELGASLGGACWSWRVADLQRAASLKWPPRRKIFSARKMFSTHSYTQSAARTAQCNVHTAICNVRHAEGKTLPQKTLSFAFRTRARVKSAQKASKLMGTAALNGHGFLTFTARPLGCVPSRLAPKPLASASRPHWPLLASWSPPSDELRPARRLSLFLSLARCPLAFRIT